MSVAESKTAFNQRAFGCKRVTFKSSPDLHVHNTVPRKTPTTANTRCNPLQLCVCGPCQIYDARFPGERVAENHKRPAQGHLGGGELMLRVKAPQVYASGAPFSLPGDPEMLITQVAAWHLRPRTCLLSSARRSSTF